MEEKFSKEETVPKEEMLSTVKRQDAREQRCAAWQP